MSEAVVTFQSQLSCVMETVFKAAMYEITRLVEDSFLEEVSRCREQVEALKRRLKWSESRRREKEGDRRGKCDHCGRVGVSAEGKQEATDRCLKQESLMQEEEPCCHGVDGASPGDEMEAAKPQSQNAMNSTQSADLQENKFDVLMKEESLRIPADTNESHDWGVTLDEPEASSIPGPSKSFNDQKIPKCHVNWESSFHQRPESSQAAHNSTEPIFQNRYSMEDLDGFDKSGYEDGNMIDMSNFEGLQASPSNLGEELSYVGHYDEDVEASEGAESQAYPKVAPQNRKGGTATPTASPSRTNMDARGEFSCLLINEEGYLQDPNVLYPAQDNVRSHAVHPDPLSNTGNIYDGYSDSLNFGERLQHQSTVRVGRRFPCNQRGVSFLDSASIKTHKQTHKSTTQAPLHACNECGKTFAQACTLKVHQRIHSGQRLHLCSHCGKTFPSFSELKTHRCVPTGDKPYSCSVCGNKFSRLWNLKLHRRIHTQEKPHRCNMCDKSFTRADILKVHQRTHTGERPYRCTVCGLSFKRLDHLKSHQRKHAADL